SSSSSSSKSSSPQNFTHPFGARRAAKHPPRQAHPRNLRLPPPLNLPRPNLPHPGAHKAARRHKTMPFLLDTVFLHSIPDLCKNRPLASAKSLPSSNPIPVSTVGLLRNRKLPIDFTSRAAMQHLPTYV